MDDQPSRDRMEALASLIVTAFASRNALSPTETPALLGLVRSTLERLKAAPVPTSCSGSFSHAMPDLAPPRRRADLSRAPWRFAVRRSAQDRSG